MRTARHRLEQNPPSDNLAGPNNSAQSMGRIVMLKSYLLTPLLLGSITVVASLLPVSSAHAACSDCQWIYVRCMSRANTPEKVEFCEQSLVDCEQEFCPVPPIASLAPLRPATETPTSPSTDIRQSRDVQPASTAP
ncbi:hypothetical protein [Lysobacter capsici]|uniref:hypothetical protein n=1 Tax=Lysobacter capsici TaxID=435897 RepID=UPI001C000DA5|nr:hypothetical protein [Lysobacter capsici]QWF17012.1 hypothetical protein KME82_25335 [Lysobacter capsici]